MTKCIVLGEDNSVQPVKKPIKFIWVVTNEKLANTAKQVDNACGKPNQFAHVELVQQASSKDYFDVMFAYDQNRNDGCLYLGHWNDGVVE